MLVYLFVQELGGRRTKQNETRQEIDGVTCKVPKVSCKKNKALASARIILLRERAIHVADAKSCFESWMWRGLRLEMKCLRHSDNHVVVCASSPAVKCWLVLWTFGESCFCVEIFSSRESSVG